MAFFIPVFEQLNKSNVRYIAVGGVATILHGYVRATTDIDLIVDLQIDEAEKAIRSLSAPVTNHVFQSEHWNLPTLLKGKTGLTLKV